jgi:hypothetical protein
MRAALLSLWVAGAAVAAEPEAKATPQVLVPRLKMKLPAGWLPKLNPGGPLTWAPKGDDEVGSVGFSDLSCLISSRPFVLGSETSSTTKSGLLARTSSRAFAAVSVSPTTLSPG